MRALRIGMIGAACALLLGLGLPVGSAWAQDVPGAKCIAAVHAEFGGVTALRAQCTPGHDCMYQAPAGNASALALLNSMVGQVETCWLAAGLSMWQEQREQRGVVRTYARPGQTCKLLLSITTGTLADGYRAACQTAAR